MNDDSETIFQISDCCSTAVGCSSRSSASCDADLEGKTDIEEVHLLEAIQYRTFDRNLWV